MERYDEVNAFVQCEINSELKILLHCVAYISSYIDTHVSIGGVVIDVFESAVDPLINSSLQLADRE